MLDDEPGIVLAAMLLERFLGHIHRGEDIHGDSKDRLEVGRDDMHRHLPQLPHFQDSEQGL